MAAPIITAIHGIVARRINPKEPAVVSLGIVQAGSAFNIIPNEVYFAGTIRSFKESTRETLFAELDRAFALANGLGGSYELEIIKGYPAGINDATVAQYVKLAVAQAESGAHVVGPSGMMDGQVAAIRDGLDAAGFADVVILAYAAKFASSFYGPFRDAVGSSLSGDRRTYQQDGGNAREALREVSLDIEEGADIVMIKPAMAYLDVVAAAAAISPVPVAAYQVSGEYSMISAAAANGWIDGRAAALESLVAIRRAGADIVLTYWAAEAAGWL
jgi:delta-aminolevulinic acid dehydratase/porphobilinogen synthase